MFHSDDVLGDGLVQLQKPHSLKQLTTKNHVIRLQGIFILATRTSVKTKCERKAFISTVQWNKNNKYFNCEMEQKQQIFQDQEHPSSEHLK